MTTTTTTTTTQPSDAKRLIVELFENGLDIILLVISTGFLVFAESDVSWMNPKQMSIIAASGAGGRMLLRSLVNKIATIYASRVVVSFPVEVSAVVRDPVEPTSSSDREPQA